MLLDLLQTVFKNFSPFSGEEYDELFTDEATAVRELMQRRRNHALEQRIRAQDDPVAAPLIARLAKPTALLFRQIATPTHEILYFLETAKRLSLQPLILEYSGDKFVGAANPYKRALGKLSIFQHTGSDGRDMAKYRTVIDFNAFTGKTLADVCCISGMSLMEFHHDLFKRVTGFEAGDVCFEGTDCFKAWGGSAIKYYGPLMTLFIRDCILFENYHPTPHERQLVHTIVRPAFADAANRFDFRPLVTRLIPLDQEMRNYWDMFPKAVDQYLP